MVFGSKTKTEAAALPEAYQRISDKDLKEAEIIRGEKREHTKEKTASSSKSNLNIGERVLIQHWQTKRWDLSGVIIEKRNRRSYLVKAGNGKRYLRNRIFLRPNHLSEPHETSVAEQSSEPELEIKSALRRSEKLRKEENCLFQEVMNSTIWTLMIYFYLSFLKETL